MGPLRSLKTSFLVNKIPDYVFNIKAFLTYHFLSMVVKEIDIVQSTLSFEVGIAGVVRIICIYKINRYQLAVK